MDSEYFADRDPRLYVGAAESGMVRRRSGMATAGIRKVVLRGFGDRIVRTRNRKQLVNLIPPFEAIPPVWELRIREYRVFYDVSEEERIVYVRAVRRKLAHRSTGEIL
jgi:hypothetical protein